MLLQAAAISETGQVLVLDMGEAVKIVDLARDLIRLSGHAVDEIAIVFSGLRPGEKLYEELLADDDATVPTSVKLLRTAHMTGQADILRGLLRRLSGAAPDVTSARDWLVCVVSEYTARA